MTYLLDTNAVIALLKNQPTGVRRRLRRAVARRASITVSSVVLFELWYGVARSERRRENAERLRVFLSGACHGEHLGISPRARSCLPGLDL